MSVYIIKSITYLIKFQNMSKASIADKIHLLFVVVSLKCRWSAGVAKCTFTKV